MCVAGALLPVATQDKNLVQVASNAPSHPVTSGEKGAPDVANVPLACFM